MRTGTRTGVASPSALRSQKAEAAAAAALLVKVRKSELIDSSAPGAELALFIAAQKGLLAELKELLKQGVAPNAVAPGRAPSCYIASQGGHADVVAALLEARADPDVPEPHAGASPLLVASHRGHVAVAKLLLGAGA